VIKSGDAERRPRPSPDEVIAIAHPGVGAENDGEDLGEKLQSFKDARFAMREGLAGNESLSTAYTLVG